MHCLYSLLITVELSIGVPVLHPMQKRIFIRDRADRTLSCPKSSRPLPNRQQKVAALLVLSLLWIAPILACGSFQPRPTPSPTPNLTQTAISGDAAVLVPTNTPGILEAAPVIDPTATFTPEPTPTITPTPIPGTVLEVGQPARVAAAGGLNLRDTASSAGNLLTRLSVGQRVTVLEGPVSADDFVWWRVDDGQGNVGWAAQGDGTDDWLTPQLGTDVQPVNRAPRVGDRVRVTMDAGQQLSIRTTPGTNAPIVTRVNSGVEFTILAGPQSANGFIWYQIRSDDGQTQGWAADGNNTIRWLSPLE
jgi:uncharacterized protein YgiM (DUF1202 family)